MQLFELQKNFVADIAAGNSDLRIFNSISRFDVYINNHHQGLIKVLKNTYPVCLALLGENCFIALSRLYIAKTPSEHFSLNNYGRGFAEFLLSTPLIQSYPYLKDVASLEWSIQTVLLEKDNPGFDFQSFARLKPVNQRKVIFHLSPGYLLESLYPIDIIWEKNQKDYKGDPEIILQEEKIWLWVSRRGFDLKLERLSTTTAHVLKMLGQGSHLEKLCLDFLNAGEGEAADAMKANRSELIELIPEMIRLGYIGGFRLLNEI